jgi:HEAT repeat protein
MSRRAPRAVDSKENWHFWWNYNKDGFLNLKAAVYKAAGQIQTESPEFFFGRSTQRVVAADTNRPTDSDLGKRVIPSLTRALADPVADVRYRAAIALGRVGGPAEVKVLVGALADSNYTVREGAATGLALLRAEAARPYLAALLEFGEEGRKLVKRQTSFDGIRGIAAIGLALLGEDDAGSVRALLMRHIKYRKHSHHIPMMCTIGLGLLIGDEQYVRGILDRLEALSAPGSRFDNWTRAQAVVATGRLIKRNGLKAGEKTVRKMIRILERGETVHLRRSAAIALGHLHGWTAPDPVMVKALVKAHRDSGDGMVRNLAAISLGRIGGQKALVALTDGVIRGRGQRRVYSGLGLGILCANLDREAEHERRVRGLAALTAAFDKARDPDVKGGLAIALGIADERDSGGILLSALREVKDVGFRGDCAVALGMVGHREATRFLLDLLSESDSLPLLKEKVAIGLGLMGTREAVPPLVQALKNARSAYALRSITQSLGFIGDRTAIHPLAELVNGERTQTLTRVFACSALGAIGDPRNLPLLTAVRTDHNFLGCCTELNYLLAAVNR